MTKRTLGDITFFTLIFLILLAMITFMPVDLGAQEVSLSDGPPMTPITRLKFYDGSSNLEYVCYARSVRFSPTTLTVTGATNLSPITITTSANHGLRTGARVTITGVGGNTAANGIWIITYASDTTFTLNGSTGNGTYTTGGTVSTYAPRSNVAIWAIKKNVYSGTNLAQELWAEGSVGFDKLCDSRTSYAYH